MILILIFVLITVLVLGIGIAMKIRNSWSNYEGWICIGCLLFSIVLLLSGIMWYENAYKDVHTEQMRYEYTSLTHQLSNNYYDRFTYDGRKKLMDDVLKYNKKIINGRAKHNSIWIGAFHPEDYDSLPLIELENYN